MRLIVGNTLILLVGIIPFLLTVDGLQCWHCSTDGSNGAFCLDPFDSDLISDYNSRGNYVECSLPERSLSTINKRAVCKKATYDIYGTIVTRRSCEFEHPNDPHDQCFYEDVPAYFKTLFCETCLGDGCNIGTNLIPKLFLILILISILLF